MSVAYWSTTRISPAMTNHPVTRSDRFQYVPITHDPERCAELGCRAPQCETHDDKGNCLCAVGNAGITTHKPSQTVWRHNHGELGERALADIPVQATVSAWRGMGKGRRVKITGKSALGEDANAASSIHEAISTDPLQKGPARQAHYNRKVIELAQKLAHRTGTPIRQNLQQAADMVAAHRRNGRLVYAGCRHYTGNYIIRYA